MTKNRTHDFSEKTKRKIIKNSGGRCSINGCHKYIDNGYVSHIYPSSENGPQRSFIGIDKTLNDNDYKSASNGMYTCRNCAEIIDNKSYIRDYPARDLVLFKAVAEFTTRVLNKYENASVYEKHKGYVNLVGIVWGVINENHPEIDFGFEISSSKEVDVIRNLNKKLFFIVGNANHKDRIKRLSAFKRSIKDWSSKAKTWYGIEQSVEKVSWRATWLIKIGHQEERLPKFIWGEVNLLIFSMENNINFKDHINNKIIYCKVIDFKFFNFKFELQAFNDGAINSSLVFLDIHRVTLSTIGEDELYEFNTHLELIKIILADDNCKLKIAISDGHCYFDQTNSGTLEVEVDYEISDQAKKSYRKIINLMQKITAIRNYNMMDFIINFGFYLKYINEEKMINALDLLKSSQFLKKILIEEDSRFKYFLERDDEILVYKMVRYDLFSNFKYTN